MIFLFITPLWSEDRQDENLLQHLLLVYIHVKVSPAERIGAVNSPSKSGNDFWRNCPAQTACLLPFSVNGSCSLMGKRLFLFAHYIFTELSISNYHDSFGDPLLLPPFSSFILSESLRLWVFGINVHRNKACGSYRLIVHLSFLVSFRFLHPLFFLP